MLETTDQKKDPFKLARVRKKKIDFGNIRSIHNENGKVSVTDAKIKNDRNESTQTQEGVNCVVIFLQVSRNRPRPCSDKLFVIRSEVKIQLKEVEEIMNTRFLRGNTSNPTEVKNHDLPL